jgi:hypothetical protein
LPTTTQISFLTIFWISSSLAQASTMLLTLRTTPLN